MSFSLIPTTDLQCTFVRHRRWLCVIVDLRDMWTRKWHTRPCQWLQKRRKSKANHRQNRIQPVTQIKAYWRPFRIVHRRKQKHPFCFSRWVGSTWLIKHECTAPNRGNYNLSYANKSQQAEIILTMGPSPSPCMNLITHSPTQPPRCAAIGTRNAKTEFTSIPHPRKRKDP